jgi:hypothetical protein
MGANQQKDDERDLDLSIPAQARIFLRDFRFKSGGTLDEVTFTDGNKISPHMLPDNLICQVALQIYHDFYSDESNGCYCEDTLLQ